MKNVFLTITMLLLATVGFPESYELTVYADGCSTPNVITCPSGGQVRVKAEATQEGSYFARWSDGNTDNPRTITLTSNTTLTAEYESTLSTLTLYAEGCGTPNVITCPSGQQVRITAEASQTGCEFVRWSDGNTDNPRTIVLTANTTLTAEYESTVRTLTLYADGCETPNVITCPTGQQVRVTAEATLAGSSFVQWNDGNTENPRLVTVTNNMTLTAEYSIVPQGYTLVDGIAYNAETTSSENLIYQRKVYNNDWNLLYVPFAMDIANMRDNHDIQIYALNMFHQYDDNHDGTFERMTMEVLELQEGNTVANHPYLFKYTGTLSAEERTNGKTLNLELGTTTLAAAATYNKTLSSMSFDYGIHGTYEAILQATAANYYTLIKNNTLGCNTFGTPTTGIKPQRWYFTMTAADSQYTVSSGAPIRIVVIGEEEMVPTNLDTASGNKTVSKKLVNGRLLIVRNGITYDLDGRIVE